MQTKRASDHPWLWWPSAVGALFLAVRATTTLLGGASFATPGDGWRSLWQLLVVAILVAGLARPRLLRLTVGLVGAIYAVSTGLELIDGTQLLGVIPVDDRDRFVHPFIAMASLLFLAIDARRDRGPEEATAFKTI